MPVIHFQLLSISDAEEAVVEIWRILEEYNLPSPGLTCMCRGSSRVKIALRVDNVMDAQTLVLLLGATGWDVEQLHGACREMRPTRQTSVFTHPSNVNRATDASVTAILGKCRWHPPQ